MKVQITIDPDTSNAGMNEVAKALRDNIAEGYFEDGAALILAEAIAEELEAIVDDNANE